jgi:Protein of unknown function (DUF2510)
MQEFSSVTASSYDADSLAPLLGGKSAEGWNVISIVSAGTNIVAYLSRDVSTADEDTGEIDTPAFVGAAAFEEAADEVAADDLDEAAFIEEPAFEETPVDDVAAIDEAIEVPSDPTPEAATAVFAETAADDAVDEPAGWGAAPEETAAPAEESVEDLATQVAEPEPEPVPVVEEPTPAESTVPAGWYADPSGRYELRYWDGTAWTEHVSRAGQQFTDPPVA